MEPDEAMFFTMGTAFVIIPATILISRFCAGQKGHGKKSNRRSSTVRATESSKCDERRRARLHAYVFHATSIGLQLDLFQVVTQCMI